MWDKKNTEERINISRYKKYNYFVNANDVEQNIQPLSYSLYLVFVHSMHFLKLKTLDFL
jgi:hypothetical protein